MPITLFLKKSDELEIHISCEEGYQLDIFSKKPKDSEIDYGNLCLYVDTDNSLRCAIRKTDEKCAHYKISGDSAIKKAIIEAISKQKFLTEEQIKEFFKQQGQFKRADTIEGLCDEIGIKLNEFALEKEKDVQSNIKRVSHSVSIKEKIKNLIKPSEQKISGIKRIEINFDPMKLKSLVYSNKPKYQYKNLYGKEDWKYTRSLLTEELPFLDSVLPFIENEAAWYIFIKKIHSIVPNALIDVYTNTFLEVNEKYLKFLLEKSPIVRINLLEVAARDIINNESLFFKYLNENNITTLKLSLISLYSEDAMIASVIKNLQKTSVKNLILEGKIKGEQTVDAICDLLLWDKLYSLSIDPDLFYSAESTTLEKIFLTLAKPKVTQLREFYCKNVDHFTAEIAKVFYSCLAQNKGITHLKLEDDWKNDCDDRTIIYREYKIANYIAELINHKLDLQSIELVGLYEIRFKKEISLIHDAVEKNAGSDLKKIVFDPSCYDQDDIDVKANISEIKKILDDRIFYGQKSHLRLSNCHFFFDKNNLKTDKKEIIECFEVHPVKKFNIS